MVIAHVRPDPDRPHMWPEPRAEGFYTGLGIRTAYHELKRTVERELSYGLVDWNDTDWYVATDKNLPRNVRRAVQPVKDTGVWYQGGRIFHASSDG